MKKRGFTVPLDDWIRGPLKEDVCQYLSQLAERSQVNSDEVSRLHSLFINGTLPTETAWHLSSLELWFRRFIDPGCMSPR